MISSDFQVDGGDDGDDDGSKYDDDIADYCRKAKCQNLLSRCFHEKHVLKLVSTSVLNILN